MGGYRRNKFYLAKLIQSQRFILIFIQEHWMSSYEAIRKFSNDFPSYEFHTTSSDSFLPPEDIMLKTGPVWHGTALGWHSTFASNISKFPTVSTRFCGIKLKTEHIDIIAYTVYLPTMGQDDDFLEEISMLAHDISNHATPESTIIIGIDANTSIKSSTRRQEAFTTFKSEFMLKTILPGDDPTLDSQNLRSTTFSQMILS